MHEKKRERPLTVDERIVAAVTRRGRRLLTYAELREEKISDEAIYCRSKNGALQRIHEAVYLVGAGVLSWQEEILAGVLAGGSTALATSFTALRLFGMKNYTPGQILVGITVKTGCEASGITFVRTRRSPPSTTRDGVPCVVVEQALLDVASKLSGRELHKLLTSLWRKRLTTPQKVLDHVQKHGGRGVKGTVLLREVASLYAGQSRAPGSEPEADFLFLLYAGIDAAGIERPELQFAIDVRGGTEKVVPDAVWPLRRKVVEMKGLEAHGDYVIQDEDVERESAIRDAGWDLDSVTPRAMRERPDRTIARIIRFLQTPNALWQP